MKEENKIQIDEQLREDDALMERLEALGWGPAGNEQLREDDAFMERLGALKSLPESSWMEDC